MRPTLHDAEDLERRLLREGVRALTAGRPQCHDCHRTPLVGERIHEYANGRVACELCRPRRREEPVRSVVVRGPEHGHAVRLRAAA